MTTRQSLMTGLLVALLAGPVFAQDAATVIASASEALGADATIPGRPVR